MTHSPTPTTDDEKIRRLQHRIEHEIRQINHDTIGQVTGPITVADYKAVAHMVSNLRARYLKAAIDLGKAHTDTALSLAHTDELRELRIAYQEALQGFEALEHALRRGYVTLDG